MFSMKSLVLFLILAFSIFCLVEPIGATVLLSDRQLDDINGAGVQMRGTALAEAEASAQGESDNDLFISTVGITSVRASADGETGSVAAKALSRSIAIVE